MVSTKEVLKMQLEELTNKQYQLQARQDDNHIQNLQNSIQEKDGLIVQIKSIK